MNFWLRRAELKEMADEFMALFAGKTFLSSDMILEYFSNFFSSDFLRVLLVFSSNALFFSNFLRY